MTKLEEAAKASWDAQERWLRSNTTWEQAQEETGKEPHRMFVRAILGAIREPTAEMCRRGVEATEVAVLFDPGARKVWQAMIDAILEEKP